MDVAGQTVNAGLPLGFEAAEELVPDDQNAGMIAIDVLRIGGVVDTMVRRRIHHHLENAGAFDKFRVDPELIEQADGLHREYHDGLEAQQGHP